MISYQMQLEIRGDVLMTNYKHSFVASCHFIMYGTGSCLDVHMPLGNLTMCLLLSGELCKGNLHKTFLGCLGPLTL